VVAVVTGLVSIYFFVRQLAPLQITRLGAATSRSPTDINARSAKFWGVAPRRRAT